VQRLKENPGQFLAVIQIGINFLGFLASAFAAVSLVDGMATWLATFGPLAGVANGIALIVVTGVLTIFTIIFGELVPKQIGLAHSERVAMSTSRFIDILGAVLGPLVGFLTWTTKRISRPFGADVAADERISAEELRLIIEQGGEQGILEAEEEQMIHAVIELGDQRIHEVMVPRIAMVTLAASATTDEAIDKVIEEGHSRIPVFEETIDEIVGILYAKDLLPFLKDSAGDPPALRTLLRTPVFVPESMSVDDLLHEFQRRKVHIAIVLDEYGGTAGLVTIEDLLEEIVGEIQDEYDVEEPLIVRLSDDEARIDGRADVDDLGELFDATLGLEDEDEYDTVGGLIYHRIGGVPKPGDQVVVDGLTLTVETTDGRRVGKVLVVRDRSADEPEDDEADR
jgi:putative hemolysin